MDKSNPDQSPDNDVKTPKINEDTHNKETHGLRDDIDANTPISDIKGPNVFERVKEEFEAIADSIHRKDKNPDSPSSIERGDTIFTHTPTKLKIQNLRIQTERSPHHHKETHGREEIDVNTPISEFKGPSIFHRAKEEIEAIVDTMNTKKDTASPKKEGGFRATINKLKIDNMKETNKDKSPRWKETHGRGEDIDVDTPISEFKGPSIFHRAKEEIEAIVDTMNSKKETSSPKKEGFRASVSKKFQRVYSKGRKD